MFSFPKASDVVIFLKHRDTWTPTTGVKLVLHGTHEWHIYGTVYPKFSPVEDARALIEQTVEEGHLYKILREIRRTTDEFANAHIESQDEKVYLHMNERP